MTVPEGWREAKLGDVADTALGKMLDRGRSRGVSEVRYLRNVNVQWGRIDTHDLRTMEIADEDRARFGVEPGDLLVCEGGEVGRAAVWRGDGEYIAFQKALHRIRPHADLDSSFLRYFIEWRVADGTLASFSTGSTIAHIPQQQLRELPILLPPHDQQRRIVELLEEHLSNLDAGQESTRSAAARSACLEDVLLAAQPAFREAERIQIIDLLASPLSNGKSVKDRPGGFPVLRLTAITSGQFDQRHQKAGDWNESEAARFRVEQGDFLCARGNGSRSLVGRGVLVRHLSSEVAFPDTMIRIRPDARRLDPGFLEVAWSSREVRAQIERVARTTAGIYKVNQRDLGGIVLPLPSLPDQRAIVTRISNLRESTDWLQGQIKGVAKLGAALRRSLLQAAFSGRLTGRASDSDRAEELVST